MSTFEARTDRARSDDEGVDAAGTNREATPEAVVVPAIHAASSVACLRSLGRRGIPTVVVSEHEAPPGFDSKYCNEVVRAPDPREDLGAYAETLLALARRPEVATILPVREVDVYALSKEREAFSEHVGTPWPTLETLRLVQDRVDLFDAAAAAGVPAPDTRRFDDWDNWDREVVIKPRYTVADYLDSSAYSENDLGSTRYVEPGMEPTRRELEAEMGHLPMVQEYLPVTDEYGFFAFYDHGEPVATFQHRQRRGYKYCGGPSVFRESTDIPALEEAGRRLLDHLDWHGVAMVEFLREEETGEFQLMEVNPRFWSSLPFTVQAGVDFPHLLWQYATGRPLDAPTDYEVGIGGHLLRGEFLYLHSILYEDYPLVERPSFARGVAAVLSSIVEHPRFDYLSRDDPGPFIRDLRNTFDDERDRLKQSEVSTLRTIAPSGPFKRVFSRR